MTLLEGLGHRVQESRPNLDGEEMAGFMLMIISVNAVSAADYAEAVLMNQRKVRRLG